MESLQEYCNWSSSKTIAEWSSEEFYMALLNQASKCPKLVNTGKKKFTTSQLSS